MQKTIRIIVVVLLFGLLASVRFFQEVLFYDPLLSFFKGVHSFKSLPSLVLPKVVVHTILRYAVNMILSLAIIWVLFKNKEIFKISALLFIGILLVLLIPYVILLQSQNPSNHFHLFYVRRFLIQPLLLLILLPAFYFQVKK